MTRATETYDLTLEHVLAAPVAQVWKALTDGEQIPKWYGASDDFKVDVLQWNCRAGGTYRVAMHAPDGKTHTCHGTFNEVAAQQRLSYSWSGEGAPPMDTLVVFELAREGERTRLKFRHTGFPSEEARANHEQGWTGSLERLARHVA